MNTLALPVKKGANRLPYYVDRSEVGTYSVVGPVPNGTHTFKADGTGYAAELADMLNAAWQVGRRTGRQDIEIASVPQ